MSKTGLRWGVLGLALLCGTALAAQRFSSLEERMTAAQFKAAGLSKLEPAELAALNAWLRDQSLVSGAAAAAPGSAVPASAAAAPVSPADVAVPEGYVLVPAGPGFDESSRETVESTIEGPFTGWTGYTQFALANGQVWEQTDRTTVRVKERSGVSVRIAARMMDTWRMKVEGVGQWVQVKRIK